MEASRHGFAGSAYSRAGQSRPGITIAVILSSPRPKLPNCQASPLVSHHIHTGWKAVRGLSYGQCPGIPRAGFPLTSLEPAFFGEDHLIRNFTWHLTRGQALATNSQPSVEGGRRQNVSIQIRKNKPSLLNFILRSGVS